MKEGLLGLQATKLPGIDMALEASGFSSTPIVQDDKIVGFNDWTLNPLRHKYKVRIVI